MAKKSISKEEVCSNDVSDPEMKFIFKSDSCSLLRIAWIIALIVCVSVAAYQTTDAIRRYLSYPAEINLELVKQIHLTLPSITFCPGDFVTYLYRDEKDKKRWPPNHLDWSFQHQQFHLRKYKITAKIEYVDTSHSVTLKDTEISTFLGICRRLVYDKPIHYKGSTTFTIFLKYTGVEPRFARFLSSDYKDSLLFMLKEKSSYPLHHIFMYSRGPLNKGTKYRFQMTATEFRSKSFPNKPCEKDIEYYTQCWDRLVNNEITQIVKCKLPFQIDESLNQSKCDGPEPLIEAIRNVTNVYASVWDSTTSNCLETCDDVHYHLIKLQEMELNSAKDLEFHVDLSENIREIVTKDFGYTIPQMLSDIGGSLGLFLGCSVLSVLEIMQTIASQLRCAKPRNHPN